MRTQLAYNIFLTGTILCLSLFFVSRSKCTKSKLGGIDPSGRYGTASFRSGPTELSQKNCPLLGPTRSLGGCFIDIQALITTPKQSNEYISKNEAQDQHAGADLRQKKIFHSILLGTLSPAPATFLRNPHTSPFFIYSRVNSPSFPSICAHLSLVSFDAPFVSISSRVQLSI